MKLIQILSFNVLIVIIFVCQCDCKHYSKNPDRETPYHEVAPLLMTEVQYKKLESLRLNITGLAEDAHRLTIWNRRSNGTLGKYNSHGCKPTKSCVYYIPKLKSDEAENAIFVSVWTKAGYCRTKPILMIHNGTDNVPGPKIVWREAHTDWTKVCSDKSCVIELHWENTCVTEAMAEGKAESRGADSGLYTLKYDDWITKDIFDILNNAFEEVNDGTKSDSSTEIHDPHNVLHDVGYRMDFICTLGIENVKNSEWHHVFNRDTTMISTPITGIEQYTLRMTLEAFDDDSYIMCTVPGHDVPPGPEKIFNIHVRGDNSPNYSKVLYYKENEKPDYHCNEGTSDTSRYMAKIKDNKIEIAYDLNNLTENDNETIVACFYIHRNISSRTFERFVENKTMLIYKENEMPILPKMDQNVKTTVDAHTDGDMSLYYYIGGAAVVLIIIMLIILLIIMKCRYKSSKLTPQLKEKSIMKSNQVLFAELELYALPNGTFTFGPSAKPKEMLYADLDMSAQPQGDKKPVQDDSPYAEIANPATLFAEVNKQQGTPVAEETPYAEIVKSDPKA